MKIRVGICLSVFMTLVVDLTVCSPTPKTSVRMSPVPLSKLCVTEGALEPMKGARLEVNAAKMRAVVAASTPQSVEARFTYLEASANTAPLGSGEVRQQFGLKLRAQDGCNLVYAMWRIEPESALVVSIKRNPGMHRSSECGNRGYTNVKAKRSSPVPKLAPGDSHTLAADLNGSRMRVSVDRGVVWEGDLGPEALSFDGPVGVRTDNGRFEFDLLTGDLGASIPCRAGDQED